MKKSLVIAASVAGVLIVSGGAATGLYFWERQQARADLDAVGINFSEANFIDEACAGNRAAVVLFLKTGMSSRTSGKDDITPLHCAARHGQDKLAKLLISKNADINARSKDERTPLHEAIARGSVEVTKLLLDAGAEINAVNRNGETPVFSANFRTPEILTLLLERGADVKIRNKNGDTPLLRLSSNAGSGKEIQEVIDLLLKQGADPNAATKDGRTPLMNAAASGSKILVEKLLAAGAEVNAQATNTTALISAAGNIELLKLLLEQKANPNLASGNAQTPLEYAARANNIEAVRILLEAGARADLETIGRDAPLHTAAANGSAEIVQLLLSKGADVNARGQGGRTALHALVTPARPNDTRRVTIAKLILESGGKIDALNSQGQTPLMLAQQMGNSELTELLSPRVQPKRPGIITPAPYPGRPPAAR